MIFQTPKEFLAHMKVGDKFWCTGGYQGRLTEFNGPLTLTSISDDQKEITFTGNMAWFRGKRKHKRELVHLHESRYFTGTDEKEARERFDELAQHNVNIFVF